MLDPPPSTLPILSGMERPLRCGLGWPTNFQSRSVPRFSTQRAASVTLGTSSLPPASSKSTLTSGSSDKRRAITDPDEPELQLIDTNALCEIYLRLLLVIRTQINAPSVFAISHHPMDNAEDLFAMVFEQFSKGNFSSSTLS